MKKERSLDVASENSTFLESLTVGGFLLFKLQWSEEEGSGLTKWQLDLLCPDLDDFGVFEVQCLAKPGELWRVGFPVEARAGRGHDLRRHF